MNLSLASARSFYKTRRTLLLGLYAGFILLMRLALPFFLGLGSFGYHAIQALRMTDFADPFLLPSFRYTVRNTRLLLSP